MTKLLNDAGTAKQTEKEYFTEKILEELKRMDSYQLTQVRRFCINIQK